MRAVAVWHTWLLIHDVGVGERASKVRAEFRMYGGLAAVAFAYLAVHPAASIAPAVRLNAYLLILEAVIGALCLWGLARTYRVVQWMIIEGCYLQKTMPDAEKRRATSSE